ncbi:substrate-binding domain-containing protein [Defluviitalea saccharophila]|uniref:Substrate-binding domain-containing protein n=1 Tax=Defluviitalea saccharophila TaxID=879970 RepID=A0ABZ2Y207_9FIRM
MKQTIKQEIIVLLFSVMLFLFMYAVFYAYSSIQDKARDDGEKYLIGVSQANLLEPWRIVMNEEIKKEAEKYKDLKLIFTDAAQSSQKQIEDIQKLQEYGIDLLIVSMNNSKELTPIVEEVYKKIPVIVLDRAVEGYGYTLFIGQDNESIGKQTGQMILDLLGEKGGEIIEIQGLKGSPPVETRSQGVMNKLRENPRIQIVDRVIADWNRDKAEDKLSNILNQYDSVDLIFAQSDAMALGAYKAAQKLGKENIKFLGVDGLSEENGGLDLVEKGILEGTFICPTGGKEAVQYAIKILNGEKFVPKKIILRNHKITSENISEYKSNKYNLQIPRTNKDRILLGFAQVGAESGWREANTRSIQSAALAEGIDLEMRFCDNKVENQIQAVKSFIEQGVDVIAFPPIIETGWEEILQEAKKKGIPIILSDRKMNIDDETLWTTYLGSDFIEEGRRAGRWLIQQTGNDKEQVNIVEIQGTIGSNPSIERKKGFEEIIREHPKFKIIKSRSGDFTFEQGKMIMKEFLEETKGNIDVVYSHNDDMALGAIEAIEEYGLNPGKDILIISIDGTKAALQALSIGKLNCVVECNPLLGPQLMHVIKDLMDGQEVPKQIMPPEDVFTSENVKRVLENREY